MPAGTSTYSAIGLNPETDYSFRVKARNDAGDSAYSNTAAATTLAAPSVIVEFAQGETISDGSVSGSYTDTHLDDGVVQIISETGSGGPKRRRKQSYSYIWIFNVSGGAGGVSLSANSWVSGIEAAVFEFSVDFGVTWQPMFVVDDTSATAIQSFLLPPNTEGSVWIRARDAEQTNGEEVDSLFVDYLAISSSTQVASPPAAPANLQVVAVVPGEIAFSFQDQADNEVGFEVRRSETDPGADCSVGSVVATLGANPGTGDVTFADTSIASDTTYWYTVIAFNGGGSSPTCTNPVSVVSASGGNIVLNVSGYKDKGLQKGSLSWSGATSANVSVFRDGAQITLTANDGEHIDNIDQKGGGSYRYQICEQDEPTICSDEEVLTF